MPSLVDRLIPPLVFLALIWFGLGWLLPRIWSGLERTLWWIALGNSREAKALADYAIRDFYMLISKKEHGEGAARPLGVVLALLARIPELPRLYSSLRRILHEREEHMFNATIANLTRGWQAGMPATILLEYITMIEEMAPSISEPRSRLQGWCAAANVRYLLGDLTRGNAAAKRNWQYAREQEPETEAVLKWMASYAYFNSTLFLGDFEEAMRRMALHWNRYYSRLGADDQRRLRAELTGLLTLNPILSVPRHMILAAAFNNGPFYEKEFWPSQEVFENLDPRSRASEVQWLESWYDEARQLCSEERISLDFSHCYAGFYYTLLATESDGSGGGASLSFKADTAFLSVSEDAPIVSRYAKWGFDGLNRLVQGRYSESLESLRRAAEFAGVSGNRFLDCLFSCSHAVAAEKVDQHLTPEVDYYLHQARETAKRIGRCFYFALCEAATAEVLVSRGQRDEARRRTERSGINHTGERILRLFSRGTRKR